MKKTFITSIACLLAIFATSPVLAQSFQFSPTVQPLPINFTLDSVLPSGIVTSCQIDYEIVPSTVSVPIISLSGITKTLHMNELTPFIRYQANAAGSVDYRFVYLTYDAQGRVEEAAVKTKQGRVDVVPTGNMYATAQVPSADLRISYSTGQTIKQSVDGSVEQTYEPWIQGMYMVAEIDNQYCHISYGTAPAALNLNIDDFFASASSNAFGDFEINDNALQPIDGPLLDAEESGTAGSDPSAVGNALGDLIQDAINDIGNQNIIPPVGDTTIIVDGSNLVPGTIQSDVDSFSPPAENNNPVEEDGNNEDVQQVNEENESPVVDNSDEIASFNSCEITGQALQEGNNVRIQALIRYNNITSGNYRYALALRAPGIDGADVYDGGIVIAENTARGYIANGEQPFEFSYNVAETGNQFELSANLNGQGCRGLDIIVAEADINGQAPIVGEEVAVDEVVAKIVVAQNSNEADQDELQNILAALETIRTADESGSGVSQQTPRRVSDDDVDTIMSDDIMAKDIMMMVLGVVVGALLVLVIVLLMIMHKHKKNEQLMQ